MAQRYAVANGNWSATATWDGGTLPGTGDDVYANNKTVTIDTSVTALSVRNTAGAVAVAGGSFVLSAGVTLTANVVTGAVSCVTTAVISGQTAAIVGNVAGSSAANNAVGATNTNTGTLTITGDVTGGNGSNGHGANNALGGTLIITGNCQGGSGSATGANNAGGGTLTIIGNCTGGSNTNAFGANNTNTGTTTITGNCTGGSSSGAHGALNSTTGTMTITGNCTGGSHASSYGAQNVSTGSLSVYGEALGTASNSTAEGVRNGSTGACYVQIAVGNNAPNDSITAGAYGCNQAALGGFITIDAATSGSGGWPGFAGRTFIRNAGTNYYTMRESNAGATLSLGELAADFPATSDVRSGVSFDAGNRTGTCAVPAAGSVAFGVAVDNTTGTAALSPTALLGADLKTRLEACATVQTVGDQLAALGT